MARILLGFVIGVLLVPVAVMAWFHWGHVPVAVADPPLPQERMITHVALDARIHREMVNTPPIQANEAAFVAGAHIFPDAPPLWEKHHNGDVVGVSDDPPGETYWKVSNGIRLSGMPSYKQVLSETEMWEVSLLLANADKPLPPEVLDVVRGNSTAATTPSATAAPATPGAPPASPQQ